MDDRRAVLHDKVWELFWKALDVDPDLRELTNAAIDLIRAETLEEVAVRFDQFGDDAFTASSVAAAIRTLKDKA